ncbi:hypothetical protein O9853_19395 [Vibrio lentus]|nr:hypothetical protein [Vibrio lentus]
MATWFAAAGTILTLAFLINQHMQLKSMQDTERADRENHEKKQQEMWQEQKEMLSFQKFQVHKEEFNKLLDQLEKISLKLNLMTVSIYIRYYSLEMTS